MDADSLRDWFARNPDALPRTINLSTRMANAATDARSLRELGPKAPENLRPNPPQSEPFRGVPNPFADKVSP